MIVVSGKTYKANVPAVPSSHGDPYVEEAGYTIEGVACWYVRTGEKSLKKINDGTTKEFTDDMEYPLDVVLIETKDGTVHECDFRWLEE